MKKEDFVLNSEYLTTLLVVVPRAQAHEWALKYEKLTDMVVPRSSRFDCLSLYTKWFGAEMVITINVPLKHFKGW